MRTNEFDPLAYIENAFLDKKRDVLPESDDLNVAIPSLTDYLIKKEQSNGQVVPPVENERPVAEPVDRIDRVDRVERTESSGRLAEVNPDLFDGISHAIIDEISDAGLGGSEKRLHFGKTMMSAPRPRRSKGPHGETAMDPDLRITWETLPKNIEFLFGFYDDSVTANYYRGEFKETRNDLIKRLLDPELSLEETSRLLGVCPATVRRYTNRKWLEHHRTHGGQRRFRLSDVVRFVDAHGRFPEE